MKSLLAALSIAAALASAQTALTPPRAGFMRDATDSMRPVYGIAGNFLLGDPVATGVISAAFSGSYGLVKTSSAIIVMDRAALAIETTAAPDGPALFAFGHTGEPAGAYLLGSNELLAWKLGAFEVVPFDPTTLAAGPIVALASPDSEHVVMIVQRDDGLWDIRVALATGAIDAQTALPGVTAPMLMLASGALIYSEANGILVRKPDGSERHITAQLPASFAIQQMGRGWIQLRDLDSGQQFAIRITEDREQAYQLPGVDQ